MTLKIGLICISLIVSCFGFGQNVTEVISSDPASGRLKYGAYTDKGDILPDFSFCGYKGGNAQIPNVKTVIELYPVAGDNTEQIQHALDLVGQMALDKDGIRGALLLRAGEYGVARTININHSGVVLRGEGAATCLVATTPKQYTLIKVGSAAKAKKDVKSQRDVVDEYVPSGTNELTLNDVAPFRVGDKIIVERPSTKEWIEAIGMDRIEDSWKSAAKLSATQIEKYRKAGQLSADGKQYTTTVQWTPGSKNLLFERVIKAIEGSVITLDIPLTNALQREYGGAKVYKYSYENRLSQVGIENLNAISLFDSTVMAKHYLIGDYMADEQHCWQFISFACAEDSWVENTECRYIGGGYAVGASSSRITIKNCRYLDPISIIEGGRRYGYTFGGQQSLVVDCFARGGRHDFVLGATVAGPNAFVNSKAQLSFAASEPHQRWATGCLWDNCSVSGPEAYFSLSNRGRYGSGHGWAGAQMVLWNCQAPLAVVMAPPTAMNFSFATMPLQDQWSNHKAIDYRIDKLNTVSKFNFKYEGKTAVGNGFIINQNEKMTPHSLYYKQLEDRLGTK